MCRFCPPAGRFCTPGRLPRLHCATQIAVAPPAVLCFVSDVSAFGGGRTRCLLAQLREKLPFHEVPIRLLFRQRKRREGVKRERP